MKKILFLLFLIYSCFVSATNNAIKMGYNFVTVSQNVVFDNAMKSGGTLTLSANIQDGGGRNPGDPITLKLVFYNSSNAVVSTVQQAYTMVLGGALAPYSVTATNCGGSCANVAYVSVQFYGKDGGYWAGNYGPYIIDPSLKFNGGSNILYNPEFVNKLVHLSNHYNSIQKMPEPINSIPRLAMMLAIIRPGKKHLIGQSWKEVAESVWEKNVDGYSFKKAHAIGYAWLVAVHMNILEKESSTNA